MEPARTNSYVMTEKQLRVYALTFLNNEDVRNRLVKLSLSSEDRLLDLLETIRSNRYSKGRYAELTKDMLSDIVHQLQEHYYDLENMSIDVWNDQEVINRIAEAHFFVKKQLIEKLGLKNSSWSIVGQIINYVFGNIPVINNSLKREMYRTGYLGIMQTNNLRKILTSIYNLYNANQDKIHDFLNKIGEIALEGTMAELPLLPHQKILLSIFFELLRSIFFKE